MEPYVKLIDISRCTGCRACQVACKQWNDLPAEENVPFTGSLQSPADLSPTTWSLVRFDEVENGSGLHWLLRHEACMHCEWPACEKVCPTGAMTKTPEGAVVHNSDLCIGCKACISACPFDIPRFDPVKDKVAKCSLCYDRILDGRVPACVTACNTGCLNFGPREQMLDLAQERISRRGGAIFPANPQYETHLLYILPKELHAADFSHLNPDPRMPASVLWWKNLFKPLTLAGMGGVLGLSALHYLIKGPHEVHEGGEDHED